MSYEGFTQLLCKNGHYSTKDAFEECLICCYCGANIIWENEVDCTNEINAEIGGQGEINMDKLEIKASILEICDHCGHTKETSPSIYRIPDREETENLRYIIKD